jgi:hypothetical protein
MELGLETLAAEPSTIQKKPSDLSSTAIANLDQISNQIKELLLTGQLIHLPGRHDRNGILDDVIKIGDRVGCQFAVASHITDDDLLRRTLGQKADDRLAFTRNKRD